MSRAAAASERTERSREARREARISALRRQKLHEKLSQSAGLLRFLLRFHERMGGPFRASNAGERRAITVSTTKGSVARRRVCCRFRSEAEAAISPVYFSDDVLKDQR